MDMDIVQNINNHITEQQSQLMRGYECTRSDYYVNKLRDISELENIVYNKYVVNVIS